MNIEVLQTFDRFHNFLVTIRAEVGQSAAQQLVSLTTTAPVGLDLNGLDPHVKKRLLKLGVAAIAGAFALSACGGNGGTSPETNGDSDSLDTTIKILAPSYSESSKSDWEALITKFNDEYPDVKVELQIEGWDDFQAKVQARIQANDLPDILNDNTFALAAEDELLYPIDEVIGQETLDTIEAKLLENGKGKDGTQWAVPDVASSRLMAYNTDIFEAAGITDPPSTWAELEEASRKIVELGDGTSAYGMPLGEEEAQVEVSLWLWGTGGDWAQGEELVVDQPDALEAMTEMKKFIDEGLTQPNVGSTNRQNAVDLFNNGKLAMLLMHTGILQLTDDGFPEINYELAPIPSKDGETVAFGVTDFIVAFDNGDEDRKTATGALLDMFYTDALYEDWVTGTGLMPVTQNMIESATENAGHFAPFYEALPDVSFLPVGNPQFDVLLGALQGTAGNLESQDPQQVLEDIQAQVDAQS